MLFCPAFLKLLLLYTREKKSCIFFCLGFFQQKTIVKLRKKKSISRTFRVFKNHLTCFKVILLIINTGEEKPISNPPKLRFSELLNFSLDVQRNILKYKIKPYVALT